MDCGIIFILESRNSANKHGKQIHTKIRLFNPVYIVDVWRFTISTLILQKANNIKLSIFKSGLFLHYWFKQMTDMGMYADVLDLENTVVCTFLSFGRSGLCMHYVALTVFA